MRKRMRESLFEIRETKNIPYGTYNKSVKGTISGGAESRGLHPILYALKRFRNYLLLLMSLIAPFNSWRVRFNKWKGINIGKNVYIGMFVFFDNAYPEYIYLEDKTAINSGTMIVTHFNPYIHFDKVLKASVNPVIIKEGAFIAIRSVILPGVTVGEYAMVTAGSVVSKEVEPYTIVRGNPAVKVADYKRRMTSEK